MRLTRISKIAIGCLLAIIVVGGAGLTYAQHAQTMDVTGEVEACYTGPFTWVVSNDDGHMTNIAGYNPIDKGDNGGGTNYDRWGSQSSNDPSEPQLPGQLCDRYDIDPKDVGKTTACLSYDKHTITVDLYNSYPSYYPTVFFGLQNVQTTPGTISSIEVVNPTPAELTAVVNGITVGQIINPGCTVVGRLSIHVEQPAQQNWTYTITVRITLSGGCENEGTPGFWRNNCTRFYSQSKIVQWCTQIDASSQWISDPTGGSWTINDMYKILDDGAAWNATARSRFLRHYLALRLNAASGRLGLSTLHNITNITGYAYLGLADPTSATLQQIVNAEESKYNTSNTTNLNIMKTVSDNINNLDN